MTEPRGGRIAALGEHPRIQGFALAGLLIVPAEDGPAVRRAWAELDADVAAVLLTPAAWSALDGEVEIGDRLVAVLPVSERISQLGADERS